MHIKSKPRMRKVSWHEVILEICKDDPIKGNFQGINRVERKLRMRNVKQSRVAAKTGESNSTPDKIQNINPSMASQSTKTEAMNVKSMQSTQQSGHSEHCNRAELKE